MRNVTFAKDYLLHRFRAKTRHGVHSPFVYRLVDQVLYDTRPLPVYNEVEQMRRKLPAGYRTATSPKLAQLLYRIAAEMQPANIIAIGTDAGVVIYLQKAVPKATVYALEAPQETAEMAKEIFHEAGLNDIELSTGNVADTLPGLTGNLKKLDFIFIDPNDGPGDLLQYFEWCLPEVHEKTVLIFNDIYRNKGIKEAWAQIKAHPQVTVTIDLFWMGLVFFRKGQAKEDFWIRV